MKMRRIFLLILCAFIAGISGCRREAPPQVCHIVTQVDIQGHHRDVEIRRRYTDEEKIGYVLLYLRLLTPSGIAGDVPAEGDLYRIGVRRADGSVTEYYQLDHRYLSQNRGPWRQIPPGQAYGLYQLMEKLPSDDI